MIATLFVTIFFLAAGMAPTIVSYYVVSRAEDRISGTIMLFNSAGILPVLVLVWTSPENSGVLVSDILTWFIIYMAAGTGVAVIWAAPHMVIIFQSLFAGPRRNKFKARQRELFEEWGPPVVDDQVQSSS
jgi:hypothetical protein